jgi:hypothetical protein
MPRPALLPPRFLPALLLLLLPCLPAVASILSQTSLEIDFTRESDASAKAMWSDNVSLAPNGLGWDDVPHTSRPGWIQTKPLAVGLWWRTSPWVGVRVEIAPAPAPIPFANGRSHTPWPGQVFARYSADRSHWSGWHVLRLEPTPEETPPAVPPVDDAPPPPRPLVYSGALGVPHRERQDYVRHMETYANLDVPWASDEEALCRWIEEKDPDFFTRSIPFVGYVEFLFEHDFRGSRRLTSLRAHVGFGISGMSAIPRDPDAAKLDDRSPWRFEGRSSKGRRRTP